MPPVAEFWKAIVASTGAVVASVGALEAEAAMSGEKPAAVAYLVAVILSLGSGIATYFKGNAEPEPEVDAVTYPSIDPGNGEDTNRYDSPEPYRPPGT